MKYLQRKQICYWNVYLVTAKHKLHSLKEERKKNYTYSLLIIKENSNIPDKSHQVGHMLVNFTTPDANMNRNRSHFTNHIDIKSWGLWGSDDKNPLRTEVWRKPRGATKIARNPTSSNRISLIIKKSGKGNI